MSIRNLIFVLALALGGLALAENPRAMWAQLADELYATDIGCEIVMDYMPELALYPELYCGYIDDTLTTANRNISDRVMRQHGLWAGDEWDETPSGDLDLFLRGYVGDYVWVIALLVGADGSLVLVAGE